jgi:hypothetical protein
MGIGAGVAVAAAAVADAAAAAGAAIGAGLASLGAAAGSALGGITLAGVGEAAGIGAGIGGLSSAIEGKPILRGMAQGGLVGGLTMGAGQALAPALGGVAGGALGGAGAGALGSAAFGGKPLMGALTGAAAGGISGAMGAFDAPTAGAGGTEVGGGVTNAAGMGEVAGATNTQSGSLASGASLGGQTTLGDAGALPGVGAPGPSAVASAAPASVSAGSPGFGGDVTAGAVPQGTEMAATDAAALANQQSLASGGIGNAGLVANAEGAPGAAPADGATGGWTIDQAQANNPNLMPLPPVPPSLDAAGNPITTAAGQAVYPTQADAQAAGFQAANEAGVQPAASGNSIAAAFDNPTLGSVGNALSQNSNWLVPAAGLAFNAGKSMLTPAPNPTAIDNTLGQQAGALNTQGQQLQSYLQTGTLPAGVHNSINSASHAAKAAIRSQYAAHGMSGSSAEAQDLASVDQRASQQGSQIAMELLRQGVSETQLSEQIYTTLLNQSIQKDNQLSAAIGSFASSMVPRTPSVTIQSGG